MNRDFNNINKQIAGFIIVSAAIAAPVVVPIGDGAAQAESAMIMKNDIQFTEIQPSVPDATINTIYRYAGPEMPVVNKFTEIQPSIPDVTINTICRYAGPEMFGGKGMIKIEPKTYVARYAGPEAPDIKNGIPPIVRYAGPQRLSPKKKTQQSDEYGLSKLETGHYIYK